MGTLDKELSIDLATLNQEARGLSPLQVVEKAITLASRPILTTNFRPYESAILHLVTRVLKGGKIIWCDSGYNTEYTYRHAEHLIAQLQLNVHRYVPLRTKGHRDAVMGKPELGTPEHIQFTDEVKLEPFRRAMMEHNPDLWFTNLRKGQSSFRDGLDIFSLSQGGILKVSPFYYWSDSDLDAYLVKHNLPNEFRYSDPTKVLAHRECGLHQ